MIATSSRCMLYVLAGRGLMWDSELWIFTIPYSSINWPLRNTNLSPGSISTRWNPSYFLLKEMLISLTLRLWCRTEWPRCHYGVGQSGPVDKLLVSQLSGKSSVRHSIHLAKAPATSHHLHTVSICIKNSNTRRQDNTIYLMHVHKLHGSSFETENN